MKSVKSTDLVRRLVVSAALCLGLVAGSAHAGYTNNLFHNIFHYFGGNHGGTHGGGGSSGNSVPELDASAGPVAIALLAGIIGIAVERRRRRNRKRLDTDSRA